jgi:indole-3-glycerol phosphate synthase
MTTSADVLQHDALARICADTRQETERRKGRISLERIRAKALAADPPRGFGHALMQAAATGYALISELKRASPSGGIIRPDLDPAAVARAYERGGATAISVLTDTPHFHGSEADFRAARAAVALPALRKDFILDTWQIYESRAMGADCVLLIMAALPDTEALELESVARSLDMDVVVEVHDRRELDRALGLHTQFVGVNNRNLKTLKTDLNTTLQLSRYVPPEKFLIAESGIRTHEDVLALAEESVRCFLVGESLMRQPDPELAVRKLLGTAPS